MAEHVPILKNNPGRTVRVNIHSDIRKIMDVRVELSVKP